MNKDNTASWHAIKTINKRIQALKDGYRQNLALLGNKTRIDYIRNNLFSQYSSPDIVVIYVNLSYIGEREIFTNIAYSLLSGYLNKYESLDSLIYTASQELPLTTSFIKETLKLSGTIPLMKDLELINKFINETSKECIFIIDEFAELKRIFKNFHQDFSQFIIFQRKCMLIITSSNINAAKSILSSELNFLFGNFEHLYLGENILLENYFYFKEILKPTKPSSMFVSFFLNIAGDNITYYNVFAEEIKRHYHSNEKQCLKNVIKNTLFLEESYFFQKFISYVDFIKDKFKNYPSVLKLLFNISRGYIRKKEIASLGILQIKNINRILNKLVELDFIINHGDVYKIKDELFSFWLHHVFSYYFYPMLLNAEKREQMFDAKLTETVDIFNTNYLKDKTERIMDLISSFNNDYLKIDNQRVRLPQINKIKLISEPSDKLSFIMGEGKDIIIVGVKKDITEDSDILYYLEKTRAFKNKNIRRIFITLDNVSPSAKVIAKENRLIVWNANDINKLLRVYCKPLIINENISCL